MREARFWPKIKFEPIFFQVLWQFFNPKGHFPIRKQDGSLFDKRKKRGQFLKYNKCYSIFVT